MRKEQGTKWRAPKRREEEFKKGISILIDQKKPKDAEKLMKVITTTCGKVLTKTTMGKKIAVCISGRKKHQGEKCIEKRRKMQRINAKAGTKPWGKGYQI